MSHRVKQLSHGVLALLLVLCSAVSTAAIEAYEFRDDAAKAQFHLLTEELRCPKCQNQNLADSNAPIAKDMREKIHAMVQEGDSSQQIVDFMVARYGDFVNYRPRRDSSTALLWYGPIGLLLVGAIIVVLVSRRRAGRGGSSGEVHRADQERLKRLLDKEDQA